MIFDPVWEERYAAGAQQRYPWSQVVSFVMRNRPKDKPIAKTRILEIGCGTGGNLWFAAREGFQVTGIDGSNSAIAAARKRFADDNLPGQFEVGEFVPLPFEAEAFDLVIDRAALACIPYSSIREGLGGSSCSDRRRADAVYPVWRHPFEHRFGNAAR